MNLLSSSSFKSPYSINDIERMFNQFKMSTDDPDELTSIKFSNEGKGRIALENVLDISAVNHEAVAQFISQIIAPGSYVMIETRCDDNPDHAWLIMHQQYVPLQVDGGYLHKCTPWQKYAEALIGKPVLDARYRCGIVEVELADIVNWSAEEFYRVLGERLIGDSLDIKGYEVIGHDGDTLMLKVEGYLIAA